LYIQEHKMKAPRQLWALGGGVYADIGLKKLREPIDGQVGISNQRAEQSPPKFLMIRDRKGGFFAFFGEDHVTAAPSNQRPAVSLESFCSFPT